MQPIRPIVNAGKSPTIAMRILSFSAKGSANHASHQRLGERRTLTTQLGFSDDSGAGSSVGCGAVSSAKSSSLRYLTGLAAATRTHPRPTPRHVTAPVLVA